jgi:hypothetical protein
MRIEIKVQIAHAPTTVALLFRVANCLHLQILTAPVPAAVAPWQQWKQFMQGGAHGAKLYSLQAMLHSASLISCSPTTDERLNHFRPHQHSISIFLHQPLPMPADPDGSCPSSSGFMAAVAALATPGRTRVLTTFETRSDELRQALLAAAAAVPGGCEVVRIQPEQLPEGFRAQHVEIYELQLSA